MQVFTIEIAGIPAEIKCRFPENRQFFREYITDKAPLITIQPTADDRERIQREVDALDESEGIPKYRRADSFLENIAVHAALAEKLPAHGVLLIHGSALCMDGEAVVFIADSGTGKSTHSRLWREVFGDRVWMLNDDKPMFRVADGRTLVYGTPWNGKHHLGRNASAPLKALVRLTRNEANCIRPIAKTDAFPMLMPFAYSSDNLGTMTLILELEKRILETADFYLLGCNMSPEAAEVAQKEIFKPIEEKQ